VINPLRSEAEAFRFLIASIVYFGAIVIASVAGGKWVGLGVFVALTAGAVGWWLHARRDEQPETTEPRPHAAGERRILVVANETVGGHALRSTILAKSLDTREEVLVVTPALNSPLRHWVSDEDGARAAAQERLDTRIAHRFADEAVSVEYQVSAASGYCQPPVNPVPELMIDVSGECPHIVLCLSHSASSVLLLCALRECAPSFGERRHPIG
jgi:hypothetical protein